MPDKTAEGPGGSATSDELDGSTTSDEPAGSTTADEPGGSATSPDDPCMPPLVNRGIRLAEDIIYCLVSLVLFGAAVALLGEGAYSLVTTLEKDVPDAVRETLDTLLLVFILVELLSATRETMSERRIVAEPFLLVGIIASIKEVVVLGIGAKEVVGKDKEAFESSMLGIGTISLLLLVLSIAILLVRRKEREPDE